MNFITIETVKHYDKTIKYYLTLKKQFPMPHLTILRNKKVLVKKMLVHHSDVTSASFKIDKSYVNENEFVLLYYFPLS